MHVTLAAAWYSPENWPYIGLALLGLGVVIFVHELGHFLAAKVCGVKCEKFYIGFDVPIKLGWGKYGIRLPAALWRKTWGETEYGIGTIPLGGYVKMLGQDDNPGRQAEMMRMAKEQADGQGDGDVETTDPVDENFVFDPRSYMAQSVPERMLIISAGVIMNIIFAVIFAAIAFKMGVPYTKCEVAYLTPGEPAWLSNLRPGDRIVEINGVVEPRFKDLQQEVILGDLDEGIPLVIERTEGERLEFTLLPHKEKIARRKHAIIGVMMKRTLQLGAEQQTVPNSAAAAVAKQLQGGGTLIAVDGQDIEDYTDFLRMLAQKEDQTLAVTFRRKPKPEEANETGPAEFTVQVAPNYLRRLGLTMKMGPVTAVQPGSPADEAGIKTGDRILQVNGQPVGDPLDLPLRLRQIARDGKPVELQIERPSAADGEKLTVQIKPRQLEWFSRFGETMELSVLGVAYGVAPVVQSSSNPMVKSGDRVVQVELVAANDEQEKKEKENFGRLKPLPIGDEGISWPTWVELMQVTQADTAIRVTVDRDGEQHAVELVQELSKSSVNPERGFIFVGKTGTMKAKSLGEAIRLGGRETKFALLAVYRFLHGLFSGQISPQLLGGPGTIAAVAGISAKEGWAELLIFLTLLSANLAVVNFLPIPVLDGGHMVFLILEGIFRRPVSERIVIPLTYAGLLLILCLMAFVISLDVNRFIF